MTHFNHTAGTKKNGCSSYMQVSSRPLNYMLVAWCACILSTQRQYLLVTVWKMDTSGHCDWKKDKSFRLGLGDGVVCKTDYAKPASYGKNQTNSSVRWKLCNEKEIK